MELTDIPGIGPTKAVALESVGINTVQDLATVDLRKPLDVNIGKDVLRSAKQEARKLLKANGIEFETATYSQTGKYAKTTTGKAAAKSAAKPAAKSTKPGAKVTAKPKAGATKKEEAVVSFDNSKISDTKATAKPAKKNFLARMFARN